MTNRLNAALARAVYELAGDLAAFGPEADRILAAIGGRDRVLQKLLDQVLAVRQVLAGARSAWLDAQRARLGIGPDARNLKLHIGCGAHAIPGWINLDVHPAPLCWNVAWGLPFADGAATHVFVSHLLEHLYFPNEVLPFLAEIRRVLAPEGRIRLVVPDVGRLIGAYVAGDREFFAARAAHWPGASGDGPLLPQFLAYAGVGPEPAHLLDAHKFGYDFDTLAHLLVQSGFTGVTRSGFMASDDAVLRIDDQSAVAGAAHGGEHYSLFVEAARKGGASIAVPLRAEPGALPSTTASPDAERPTVAALAERAQRALAEGRLAEADALLAEARILDPADPQLARRHGLALARLGRLDAAEAALRSAIAIDRALPGAHLHLGRVLEAQGRRREAVGAYFRALTLAQGRGQWLDEATTPPGLRDDVLHAMALVREQRVPVLLGLIEPFEARHGREAVARIRAGLAHWLGIEAHPPPDPRQAPRFFHVPGLPSTPWFDRDLLPWLPALEASAPILTDEARAILERPATIEPFLGEHPGADLSPYLGGGPDARWNAFFFYRDGVRRDTAGLVAPRTASLLETLPLVRIREHAPEICFSILEPGTHIKPHHGVTNARIVVHLGLIIPDGASLTVADDERHWQAGFAWAFDDTFLHEARNRSAEARVILLMDAWHPHLTAVEREAFKAVVEGIGEFHRG